MSIIPSVLYYFQHVPLTRDYLMSHISGLHSTPGLSRSVIYTAWLFYHYILLRPVPWGFASLSSGASPPPPPQWRIGECSPDMAGTGEIKYPRRTKTSTAALQFDTGVSRARGRKLWSKITWCSSLGGWCSRPAPCSSKKKIAKKLTGKTKLGILLLTFWCRNYFFF